jgi:tetratricopeptide (TPR) repeat protein
MSFPLQPRPSPSGRNWNGSHRTVHLLLCVCTVAVVILVRGASASQVMTLPTGTPAGTLDLSDPQALEKRGDLYMVRKFYPEAIEVYGRLVKLEPRNAVYQNKLGIAYHQMQKYDAAQNAYRAAIRLNPNYSEATNNLAAVEYAKKKYRSAILTYLKALKLSPSSAVVYSNLGTAYFAYKKYDYAMACYRYALMLDPKIFITNSRTGSIVQQRGTEDMATYNFYLAKTYAGLGDVDNTLLYISKAWDSGYKDLLKELNDKAFAFLANEPRFLALLARIDPARQNPVPAASAP